MAALPDTLLPLLPHVGYDFQGYEQVERDKVRIEMYYTAMY